ncbi:hypothetical protein DFQ27_003057, partial [Actinomortierella ambigua]
EAAAASSEEAYNRVVNDLISQLRCLDIWLMHWHDRLTGECSDGGQFTKFKELIQIYNARHEQLSARLERIQHGVWPILHDAVRGHNKLIEAHAQLLQRLDQQMN